MKPGDSVYSSETGDKTQAHSLEAIKGGMAQMTCGLAWRASTLSHNQGKRGLCGNCGRVLEDRSKSAKRLRTYHPQTVEKGAR